MSIIMSPSMKPGTNPAVNNAAMDVLAMMP